MTKTKVVYDVQVKGATVKTCETLREAKEAAAPYERCEIWQYNPDTSDVVDCGMRVYAKI